ncbi:MAG TPA: Uma2 family endonuclease [Methylomirabilota bacterium]|nr:Uma2 family endonuclease [Methylomirabilota bacterium]
MGTYPARLRRWSRAEYERLIEAGIFQPGEPIELLDGELMVSAPQGSAHYTAVGLVEDALRAALGRGWLVRAQGPIALSDDSEPEPDVAVTRGSRRDYRDAHPSRPALVVEVAESSLTLDREHKGSLYAQAGVADYWILNLVDRVLEVYREPRQDLAARFGWRYAWTEVLSSGSCASPLVAPGARVSVSDLLP